MIRFFSANASFRSRVIIVGLLASSVVLSTTLQTRMIPTGDALSNRLLPISFLRDGDVYLDEFLQTPLLSESMPMGRTTRDGHFVSAYPIGSALLAVPIYAPFVWSTRSLRSR